METLINAAFSRSVWSSRRFDGADGGAYAYTAAIPKEANRNFAAFLCRQTLTGSARPCERLLLEMETEFASIEARYPWRRLEDLRASSWNFCPAATTAKALDKCAEPSAVSNRTAGGRQRHHHHQSYCLFPMSPPYCRPRAERTLNNLAEQLRDRIEASRCRGEIGSHDFEDFIEVLIDHMREFPNLLICRSTS
jgi:hypothetical protein